MSYGTAKKLGERLRLANPETANKPKAFDHDKTEEAESDLAVLVKNIGTTVDGKYVRNPNCLAAVKTLLMRINKLDRRSHKLPLRRYLVRSGIVRTDLFPLLLANSTDEQLWQVVIWLMFELTISPDRAIELHSIPKDQLDDNPDIKVYLRELDDRRQSCKKLFTDVTFFTFLRDHVTRILRKEEEDRAPGEQNFVAQAFGLLRNIFEMRGEHIGAALEFASATIQDRVFIAFYESAFSGVLSFVACSENEERHVFPVLEVLYYLLRDYDPESLGKPERAESDNQNSRETLRLMTERSLKDKQVKKGQTGQFISRHSLFGGTFTVKGSRALDPENEIVLMKPIASIFNKKLDPSAGKSSQIKPRNRKPVYTVEERRIVPVQVISALRTFCAQFLKNAYNVFMETVKNELIEFGDVDTSAHQIRYFWCLRFFLAFNRSYNFEVANVSETMSTESFHTVHVKLEYYTDMLMTEKKEFARWSDRAHVALRAYQELLLTLSVMLASEDPTVERSAKQIESNIFYIPEYREIFFALLRQFNEARYSRLYLKDLIATIHVFIKLLEVYLKAQSHLFVLAKKRKKHGAKKKQTKGKKQPAKLKMDDREKIWTTHVKKIENAVVNAGSDITLETISYVPVDLSLTLSENEQKDMARSRVQSAILENDFDRAVGLLKASKEIWQLDEAFGKLDDTVERDLARLKEILMLELADKEVPVETTMEENDVIEDEFDALEAKADLKEDESNQKKAKEVEFELSSYIKRFATPSHLEPYLLLLNDYATNSFLTNHAIIKMLHRIAGDLDLPAILFQVSLFRLYQRILKTTEPRGDPRFHIEFREFMQFLTEKFFDQMRKDRKTILTTLFWKSRGEAYELLEGRPEKPPRKDKSGALLMDLQNENGGVASVPRAESPEDDDVDVFAHLRSIAPPVNEAPGKTKRKRPITMRNKPKEPRAKKTAVAENNDEPRPVRRRSPSNEKSDSELWENRYRQRSVGVADVDKNDVRHDSSSDDDVDFAVKLSGLNMSADGLSSGKTGHIKVVKRNTGTRHVEERVSKERRSVSKEPEKTDFKEDFVESDFEAEPRVDSRLFVEPMEYVAEDDDDADVEDVHKLQTLVAMDDSDEETVPIRTIESGDSTQSNASQSKPSRTYFDDDSDDDAEPALKIDE